MNPPISITIGSADPNAAPLTVNELFALLQTVISGSITGSYIPYIIGGDVPGVDDRDKAWIRLDTAGRPIETKVFYNGNWRRIYNGMLGEIRPFAGDPTITTDWDNNGHGVIGGTYDGWQICNGQNGSPDLSNNFILAANMSDTSSHGYDHLWKARIVGPDGVGRDYDHGGEFTQTINQTNLPSLSNAAAGESPGLYLHGFESKDGTAHPDAVPIVDVNYANLKPHSLNIATYGQTPNVPLWTTPSFIALGYMIFQGYSS